MKNIVSDDGESQVEWEVKKPVSPPPPPPPPGLPPGTPQLLPSLSPYDSLASNSVKDDASKHARSSQSGHKRCSAEGPLLPPKKYKKYDLSPESSSILSDIYDETAPSPSAEKVKGPIAKVNKDFQHKKTLSSDEEEQNKNKETEEFSDNRSAKHHVVSRESREDHKERKRERIVKKVKVIVEGDNRRYLKQKCRPEQTEGCSPTPHAPLYDKLKKLESSSSSDSGNSTPIQQGVEPSEGGGSQNSHSRRTTLQDAHCESVSEMLTKQRIKAHHQAAVKDPRLAKYNQEVSSKSPETGAVDYKKCQFSHGLEQCNTVESTTATGSESLEPYSDESPPPPPPPPPARKESFKKSPPSNLDENAQGESFDVEGATLASPQLLHSETNARHPNQSPKVTPKVRQSLLDMPMPKTDTGAGVGENKDASYFDEDLEDIDMDLDEDEDSSQMSPLTSEPSSSKVVEIPPPPKQGILSKVFRDTYSSSGQDVVKKSVTFADGLKPGNEDYDSDDPISPSLIVPGNKERRHKSRIRMIRPDSPPPPPPPPGSPPPPPPPPPKKTVQQAPKVVTEQVDPYQHYPSTIHAHHQMAHLAVAVTGSPQSAPIPGYSIIYSYPGYPGQPMYAPVAYTTGPMPHGYATVYPQQPATVYLGTPPTMPAARFPSPAPPRPPPSV